MKSHGCRWIASLTTANLCLTIFIFANLALLLSPEVQASSGDDLISLNVQNKPLGEVLDQISESTGYEFTIDASWKNRPVTSSLTNVPLHDGLKRILGNLNNAIIYEADGKIRIVIHEKTPSGRTPGSYQGRTPSYPRQTPRRRASSPPPVTRPPVSEPADSPEATEEATEEETESSQESAESDENTGKKQKVKPKASAGKSSTTEEEEEETAPEKGPEETAQPESTTPDETPKNETDEQSQ